MPPPSLAEQSPRIAAYLADPVNAGKSRRQAARDLGIHESLIRRHHRAQPLEANMVAATQCKRQPKVLNLDPRTLKCDPAMQPRASVNFVAEEEYARRYAKGLEMGHVVVFRTDEGDLTADGHHRVAGAIKAEVARIACEVYMGTRSDALAFALSANLKHNGIRYTNADKRRAVGLALTDPELSGKTDEAIGRLCGVSDRTVGRARAVLTSDIVGREETQTRTGADGKQYPVRPRKPRPEAEIEPPRDVADLPDDAIEPAPAETPEVDEACPSQVEGKGDAFEGPAEPELPDPVAAEPTAGPVTVSRSGSSPSPSPEPPEPKEADLPDEAWLETLPARAQLADYPRRVFDDDALFFREFQPFVAALRNSSASLRKRYRLRGRSRSYQGRVESFLSFRHPKDWVACKVCNGTARVPLIGECAACKGRGYYL